MTRTMREYKARSLAGANAKVRELYQLIDQYRDALRSAERDLHEARNAAQLVARLAADGPAFFNPLDVYAAQQLRNRLLRECGLGPDGSPLPTVTKPR